MRVTRRPFWVLTQLVAESTLTASAFPWGDVMRVPALAACLLVVFSSSGLHAQSTNASLSGRVTDPSHALISDAKVAAITTAQNFRHETKTNNSGEYYLTISLPVSIKSESKNPASKN